MAELHSQSVVARLSIGQGRRSQLGLGRVVVEVDMRSPNDPPIELAILDLVLPEGKELGVRWGGEDGEDGEGGEDGEVLRKSPAQTGASTGRILENRFH